MKDKFSKKSVTRLNNLYRKVENPKYSIEQIARETKKVVAQLKPFERPLYERMAHEMKNDPTHIDEILRKYGLTPGKPNYQQNPKGFAQLTFQLTEGLLRVMQAVIEQNTEARIISPEDIEGFDELSKVDQLMTKAIFEAFLEKIFTSMGERSLQGEEASKIAYEEVSFFVPSLMVTEEGFAKNIWPILQKCGFALDEPKSTRFVSWELNKNMFAFNVIFPRVVPE